MVVVAAASRGRALLTLCSASGDDAGAAPVDEERDCCVQLYAEVHAPRGGDGSDWRPAFATSSLACLSPAAYLALRVVMALFMARRRCLQQLQEVAPHSAV